MAGPGEARRRRDALRAASVRSPAVHHVFLRHHRPAEEHRALGRRYADPAPEGAEAALRCPARRRCLLLHHLRLDDVELVREQPGPGRHHRLLRRQPFLPRPRRADPAGRRAAVFPVRDVGEIHCVIGTGGRDCGAWNCRDAACCVSTTRRHNHPYHHLHRIPAVR